MNRDPEAALRIAVIIPAAGLSTRFGRNKLHESIGGKSVLLRTIEAFLNRPDTGVLILTTPPGTSPPESALPPDVRARLAAGDMASIQLTAGGATRAQTVQNALGLISEDIHWIAVHDAARPLVSNALIDRVYAHAIAHGSAAPAMPVKLTIKQAAGPLPARVVRTMPRHELWEMQTPQVFNRGDLSIAYAECKLPLDRVTDDAQLLELAGRPVWLVPGEEQNLKVTTPQDLLVAELILRNSAAAGTSSVHGPLG